MKKVFVPISCFVCFLSGAIFAGNYLPVAVIASASGDHSTNEVKGLVARIEDLERSMKSGKQEVYSDIARVASDVFVPEKYFDPKNGLYKGAASTPWAFSEAARSYSAKFLGGVARNEYQPSSDPEKSLVTMVGIMPEDLRNKCAAYAAGKPWPPQEALQK
jgi:hypothetical protein